MDIEINKDLKLVSGTEKFIPDEIINALKSFIIKNRHLCIEHINDNATKLGIDTEIINYGYIDQGYFITMIEDKNNYSAIINILKSKKEFLECTKNMKFYNTKIGNINKTPMIMFYELYEDLENEYHLYNPYKYNNEIFVIYGIDKETFIEFIKKTETIKTLQKKICIQRLTNKYNCFNYSNNEEEDDENEVEEENDEIKYVEYYEKHAEKKITKWNNLIKLLLPTIEHFTFDELAVILVEEAFIIMKSALFKK